METASMPDESCYLEIDLKDNGGIHRFKDRNAVLDWLTAEMKAWQPFDINRQTHILDSLNTIGKQDNSKDSDFKAKFLHLMELNYINSRCCIASNSRLGIFILSSPRPLAQQMFKLSIAQENVVLAVPRETIFAACELVLFNHEFGTKEGVSAANATFEDVRRRWDEEFAKSNDAWNNAIAGKVAMLVQQERDLDSQVKAHQLKMNEMQTDYRSLCVTHQNEMANIEKRFRDDLAVRAAVEYWHTKKSQHEDAGRRWGLFATFYGVIAFILVVTFVYPVAFWIGRSVDIEGLLRDGVITGAEAINAMSHLWLSATVRFVAITLLMAWPIRIIIRNYMSNVHLASDAAERAIVVQTYLALVNDPDVQSNNDLKKQVLPHALQNVFRHTEDGIVRDDAMPSEWMSWFGKPK